MVYEEIKKTMEGYASKIPVERRGEDGLPLPEDEKRANVFWDEVFAFIEKNKVPQELQALVVDFP